MRGANRDFNLTERILLIILGLLVVGAAYYYCVYLAVNDNLAEARSRRESLETELSGVQMYNARMLRMQEEMDALGAKAEVSRMESYNNSKAEIALLNDILVAANQYSISFSGLSRNGDQIRRSFELRFTANDFETAEAILARLSQSSCRCLIGDMSCSSVRDKEHPEAVDLNLVATFYETMVGGTPDAGLPEDGGKS